jgi:phage head maturation protease
VLYSHAGPALGLTRQFIGCEDGGLDCELWLMPTRRAQAAGEYVRAGLLDGLSIGVRVYRSTCDYLSPREWQPATGALDLERQYDVEPCEVSLTPTPAQDGHTVIRNIW